MLLLLASSKSLNALGDSKVVVDRQGHSHSPAIFLEPHYQWFKAVASFE